MGKLETDKELKKLVMYMMNNFPDLEMYQFQLGDKRVNFSEN